MKSSSSETLLFLSFKAAAIFSAPETSGIQTGWSLSQTSHVIDLFGMTGAALSVHNWTLDECEQK